MSASAIRCLLWFEGSEHCEDRYYAGVPRIGDALLVEGVEHEVVRVRWPEGRDEIGAQTPSLVVRRATRS